MCNWEEKCRDGFAVVDSQQRIAVKTISQGEDTVRQIQRMLIESYLRQSSTMERGEN